MKKRDILIKKYFEDISLINSDIESFNNFIEIDLQKIVDENGTILPTIIPHTIDEFKIKFGKIDCVLIIFDTFNTSQSLIFNNFLIEKNTIH